jgi:hypothetical protein
MAKAQRINDHSFWAGGKTSTNPFPNGVKSKQYMSAMSDGKEMDYEDTTEEIKKMQDKNTSQAKKYPMKPSYRN